MTRLTPEDIHSVSAGLKDYDGELRGKTGRNLLGVACHAAGIPLKNIGRRLAKTRVAVVPCTAGEGLLPHFTETVAAIGRHIGLNSFFTAARDAAGIAEAVERLARRFGVHLPPRSPEARKRRELGDRQRSLLGEAQKFFTDCLVSPDGAEARSELARRGFGEEEWRSFGFGYAPNAWRGLLGHMTRRHPEGTLVDAGLAVRPDSGTSPYDRFRKRITFPIRSGDGSLIAFGGRILGEGEPKYLNSPETAIFRKRSTLFCLDRARRPIADTSRVLVVEGYFDCLSLHRVGVDNTVATLGTALTPDHARLLKRAFGRARGLR